MLLLQNLPIITQHKPFILEMILTNSCYMEFNVLWYSKKKKKGNSIYCLVKSQLYTSTKGVSTIKCKLEITDLEEGQRCPVKPTPSRCPWGSMQICPELLQSPPQNGWIWLPYTCCCTTHTGIREQRTPLLGGLPEVQFIYLGKTQGDISNFLFQKSHF